MEEGRHIAAPDGNASPDALAAFLRLLPLPAFATDAVGIIVAANSAFHRLVDAEDGKLAGQPLGNILPSLPLCPGYSIEELAAGLRLQVDRSALPGGGILAVATDVTAAHRAALDLEQARAAAEAAARAKADFLANISHEIRTPLNGIIGMTTLLGDTRLSVEQEEFVNTIKSSGDVLIALLNDVLDFSRIDAGKLELEPAPFNLRDSLDEVGELMAARAHEKGLEFGQFVGPEVPNRVVGDARRLRQILLNLVSNAVKFTSHGEVLLAARVAEHTPRAVVLVIEVSDTGIGISSEQRRRLFQPFSQGDASTTRRFGGSGLGLAIAAHLAHLMGGRIDVDSEPDKGSTFRLSVPFPIADAQRRDQASTYQLPYVFSRTDVVVLHPSPAIRSFLCEKVRIIGANPHAAAGAEEALALLRARGHAERFAFVVSEDWKASAHEELRRRLAGLPPDLAAAPVILLRRVSAKEGHRGFAHAVAQPVRESALAAVLARAVAGREPARPEPLSILLVEENQVNQKVAQIVLGRAGYLCDTAATGVDALHAAAEKSYDIVMMDCLLPDMDGFEAARALRAQSRRRQPVIIALSSSASAQERSRAESAGMNDFLLKPFEPRTLLAMIEKFAG